jgi:hypothetical protein
MAEPLASVADRYWPYREVAPRGPVLAMAVEWWAGWSGARAD